MIDKAQMELKNKEFKKALNSARGAKSYPKANVKEADALVDKIFDAIDAERERAEKATINAQKQQALAMIAQLRSDSLYQIAEAQRMQADKERAIAEKALESEKRSIWMLGISESNKFEELGAKEQLKGNFIKATEYYGNSITILKETEPKDSTVVLKTALLIDKVALMKQLEIKQNSINETLQSSDSLIMKGVDFYENAYENYLNILDIGVDSSKVVNKILELENIIDAKSDTFKGPRYFNLLSYSIKGNQYVGYDERAKKRLLSMKGHQPWSFDFIQNSTSRELLKNALVVNWIVPTMKLYKRAGVSGFSIAAINSKKFGYGIEGYLFGNTYKEYGKASIRETTIFILYEILKKRNRKWNAVRYKFIGSAGPAYIVLRPSDNMPLNNLGVFEIPEIYNQINSAVKFKYNNINIEYSKSFAPVNNLNFKYFDAANHHRLNFFTGLRFEYNLGIKIPIFFMAGVDYNFRIAALNKKQKYNVVYGLEEHFKSQYNLSEAELLSLRNSIANSGVSKDTKLNLGYKEYYSGISLKIGIGLRQ
jgi:hypothetical protein